MDPHTVLPAPISGPTETIRSLRRCAAAGGYGQVALLPRGQSWRDQPERLIGLQAPIRIRSPSPLGEPSREGHGEELTPHGDLLEHGAIGLADDDAVVPLPLLERGLLLGEMGSCPVLVAPRDPVLQGDGMAREGVTTLRAGWAPDPLMSELLPVQQLLALQQRHPERQLRLMNLSTAAAVDVLSRADHRLKASVCWWHLLVDGSELSSTDPGCRVRPSWVELRTDRVCGQPCNPASSRRLPCMPSPLTMKTCCCRLINALRPEWASPCAASAPGLPWWIKETCQSKPCGTDSASVHLPFWTSRRNPCASAAVAGCCLTPRSAGRWTAMIPPPRSCQPPLAGAHHAGTGGGLRPQSLRRPKRLSGQKRNTARPMISRSAGRRPLARNVHPSCCGGYHPNEHRAPGNGDVQGAAGTHSLLIDQAGLSHIRLLNGLPIEADSSTGANLDTISPNGNHPFDVSVASGVTKTRDETEQGQVDHGTAQP